MLIPLHIVVEERREANSTIGMERLCYGRGVRPQVHLSELASVVQLVKLASGECPLVSLPLCVSLARASFGRRAERVASRCACFAASAHERLCDGIGNASR